jgi:recombination protein U
LKLYTAYGNRGKALEHLIDRVNIQYKIKGIADIRKVPTPTKVFKYERGRIRDGVFEKGEWVDYVGVAQGRAVAFDAKETRETTRFELDNVHDHQVEFLKSWHDQGAKAFLLVCFVKRDHEIYVLEYKDFVKWWEGSKNGGRKSIPYDWFVANCFRAKPESGILLHYLRGVLNV